MTTKSLNTKEQKSQPGQTTREHSPTKKEAKQRHPVKFKVGWFMVPHKISTLTKTGVQTLVLIYLMECGQYKDGDIYCSYNAIHKACHIAPRTAYTVVHELAELGLIRITPRKGKTNLIEITISGVEPLQHLQDTHAKFAKVPLQQLHTTNKDFTNKDLLKRENLQKRLESPERFSRPPKSNYQPPERVAVVSKTPGIRVFCDGDRDIEPIPLSPLLPKIPTTTTKRTTIKNEGGKKKDE